MSTVAGPTESVAAASPWLTATVVAAPRRHAQIPAGVSRPSYDPERRSSRSRRRRDEVPAQVEHRVRVLPLIRDVPGGRVTHREPRLDVGAREPAVARPLHRRPALVPAWILRPVADADRVLQPVAGHIDVPHPDLVAVIEERRASEREEREEGCSGASFIAVAPAAGEPTGVVVRPVPEGPRGRGQHRLGPFDDLAHLLARRREHERHVEREVELVLAVPVEATERLQVQHPRLAEENGPVRVGDRAPPPQHVVCLGPVHAEVRAQTVPADARMVRLEGDGVVPQRAILDERVRDIDPEPGDASVEPEPHDVVEGIGDLGVPPVQVRLLRKEVVEVELARHVVPGPGRAAERRSPVVGRRPVGPTVGPDVPVATLRGAARARVHEPRMLVARVVGNEVDQHVDPAIGGLRHQPIEILQGAEVGIDIGVVSDVVAPVRVRGGVDRTEPDPVDPEPRQVVEVLDHPTEVAVSGSRRVGEGARIDLVQDAVAPPP